MNPTPEMIDQIFRQLQKLREPFPPNQISYIPKGNVKLAYVGHAAMTDRLLDVDPMWTWEPLSMNDGLPVMDTFGGMWIKLTVCGVTRLGYGHAGDKEGGDAIKEVIGDALRNAAMRFGAALELWHKGNLHVEPTGAASDVCADSFRKLQPEVQDSLRAMIPRIVVQATHKNIEGVQTIFAEARDNWPDEDPAELKKGLWHLLDSKTRSAISAVEKK